MADTKQGTQKQPATLEGNDKDKLVQVKPNAGLSTKEDIPDYLKDEQGGLGLEEMDRGDMVLPRLAIAQSLSPAMKKNNPKYIAGLEEGMFYNTVTREIYGMKVNVVPILFSKMRIWFEEISKGGGILCTSTNGIDGGRVHPSDCATCPHSGFGEDGTPPDCNNFMNYACILPDHGNQVIVVSMKSTAIAVAKQWNSMMRLLNKPAFSKTYQLDSMPETRNGNDYFNYKVTQLQFVAADIYAFGKSLYEELKSKGIKVDLEDEDLHDASFNTDNMEQASKEM